MASRRTSIPRHVVIMDSETEKCDQSLSGLSEYHRLKLGIARYLRYSPAGYVTAREVTFRSSDALFDFVSKAGPKKDHLWILAHNFAFDAAVCGIYDWIDSGKLIIDKRSDAEWKGRGQTKSGVSKRRFSVCLERSPWFIIGHINGRKVSLVDTLNYWPIPLVEIGRKIGIEKGTYEDAVGNDDELEEYCRNDVAILEEAFKRTAFIVGSFSRGQWRTTMSQMSDSHFCTDRVSREIRHHELPEIKTDERKAYYGGESYCWYVGRVSPDMDDRTFREFVKGDNLNVPVDAVCFSIDVNSLYPFVMQGERYPVEYSTTMRDVDVRTMDRICDQYCVVAECVIRGTNARFPVRHNGRVRYPIGQYVTWLTTPEVQRAIQNGQLIGCPLVHVYRCKRLFVPFVSHWTEIRYRYESNGGRFESGICKLLMNSLYGRFGRRMSSWVTDEKRHPRERWSNWIEVNIDTGEMIQCRSIGSAVQTKTDRGEVKRNFPAIAAHVTAYGREQMRSFRSFLPTGSVLYQYVDSLLVTRSGLIAAHDRGMIVNGRMGKFKIEDSHHDVEIRSVGDYTVDGVRVTCGMHAERIADANGSYSALEFRTGPDQLVGGPRRTVRIDKVERAYPSRPIDGLVTPSGWVEPMPLPLFD